MTKREIETKLAEIFQKRFSLDFPNNPETKEMKLLGKSGIPASELLHVYFDVKNIFGISIPEEDIVAGRFDTFSHITDIICEQMAEGQQ
jgi:peptide maturation system acyl carrier-related protein